MEMGSLQHRIKEFFHCQLFWTNRKEAHFKLLPGLFVGSGANTFKIIREHRKHLVIKWIQCWSAPFIPPSAKESGFHRMIWLKKNKLGWSNLRGFVGDHMRSHVGRMEDEITGERPGGAWKAAGVFWALWNNKESVWVLQIPGSLQQGYSQWSTESTTQLLCFEESHL